MTQFQKYLKILYLNSVYNSKRTIKLSELIQKEGILLKNNEWKNHQVIDLSTMPQDNICIITSSNGSEFTTNIKTLEDDTLLYGSIRPYFKKCGFTVSHQFVTGTIHSFKPRNKKLLTFLLGVICSNSFHNYTNINSQGTKMPIINWETFINYDVPILEKSQMDLFYDKTIDLYNYIKKIMCKNLLLYQLKHLLLNKYFD